MKKLILTLMLLPVLSGVYAQSPSANDIIRKADEKNRGLSSQGTMTMTVVRPDWTRTITMKTWSKEKEYSLVLITAPAKDKGQVFLKVKTEMWNWVPSIDKTIKIPPSMMLQSWMGSDFTNDDLVKQSSIIVDYTHKLLGLTVGDTLVLLGQGYHGVSAAGKFPVSGIIHIPSPQLDNQMVYMNLPAAQDFFSAENRITSLSLACHTTDQPLPGGYL